MSKNNWNEVSYDILLSECSLFSYPDIIYVLNLSKAPDSVKSFFSTFKNKDRSLEVIKHSTESSDSFMEEIDESTGEDFNTFCVFAYYYEAIEGEAINDSFFDNGDQAYIFNGLSFTEHADSEEQAKMAINVSGYEVF